MERPRVETVDILPTKLHSNRPRIPSLSVTGDRRRPHHHHLPSTTPSTVRSKVLDTRTGNRGGWGGRDPDHERGHDWHGDTSGLRPVPRTTDAVLTPLPPLRHGVLLLVLPLGVVPGGLFRLVTGVHERTVHSSE